MKLQVFTKIGIGIIIVGIILLCISILIGQTDPRDDAVEVIQYTPRDVVRIGATERYSVDVEFEPGEYEIWFKYPWSTGYNNVFIGVDEYNPLEIEGGGQQGTVSVGGEKYVKFGTFKVEKAGIYIVRSGVPDVMYITEPTIGPFIMEILLIPSIILIVVGIVLSFKGRRKRKRRKVSKKRPLK